MLALCRRINIPPPKCQHWILLPDGGPRIRADFAWPDHKLTVETDSHWHDTAQRREQDNDRDQRLLVHHIRTIRTSRRQIIRRPQPLEQRLISLLGA